MAIQSTTSRENQLRCQSCGADVQTGAAVCPRCGRAIHNPNRLRALGAFVLVIGIGLTGFLTYLMIWIAGVVAQSGNPQASVRFSGTPRDAALIHLILGTVCLFGVTAIAMGLWMVVRGTRNRKLVKVVMVWYILFWVAYLAFEAQEIWKAFSSR